jgi:hypothetical protein
MTTLAKIEANQRNGQLSAGPRTPEGKAIVSRNAIKHGIFAVVPVLPGECPDLWEAHRAGVVESLAPVGLLEVNLAERAALLLWRLQRLARYEAETTATAMQNTDLPALPPAEDDFTLLHPPPKRQTRAEQLREIRRELRTARDELQDVGPARDHFRVLPEAGADGEVPFATAETILNAACARAEIAENLRADPPAFDSKPFLRKLGVTGVSAKAVTWTPDLICRGLAVYAGYAQEDEARFRRAVGADLDEWAEDLNRKVVRLEREVAALVWLLDGSAEQNRVARVLPADGRDERIAKYERHLHGLLTSMLHELERLQARREGEVVPPPAVADVNVTVDAGPG